MEDLIQTIYYMTSSLQLTGLKNKRDEEAESFAILMEEREPLIKQLEALRDEITPDIKRQIDEIIAMDKRNYAMIKNMHEEIRTTIKEAKTARKINEAYGEYGSPI
jgi:DNA repair exonuclease SbcCD ATPase subunit